MASEGSKISTKRSNESVSGVSAKKARTKKDASRVDDIEKIKSLIADIDSADLKRALEALIGQAFSKKALVTPLKQLDDAGVKQEAGKVMRKIQSEINSKLKWKNSFRNLKGENNFKGARVEVVCSYPEAFEEIFKNRMGATIKTSKDGKMSCSMKTNDEVKEELFSGPSYRYNSAVLNAPFTASLKDNALVFGFKFTIW